MSAHEEAEGGNKTTGPRRVSRCYCGNGVGRVDPDRDRDHDRQAPCIFHRVYIYVVTNKARRINSQGSACSHNHLLLLFFLPNQFRTTLRSPFWVLHFRDEVLLLLPSFCRSLCRWCLCPVDCQHPVGIPCSSHHPRLFNPFFRTNVVVCAPLTITWTGGTRSSPFSFLFFMIN